MESTPVKITLHPEQAGKTAHAQLPVSGDVTLPGSLRDVVNVLHATAMAVVENAEPMQDKANLSGRVVFRVLYTKGEEAHTDAIEASADFTHLCDCPGCTPRAQITTQADAPQVEASVSGGRMNLRTQVHLTIAPRLADAVEAVADLPEEGVEKKSASVKLRRTASTGSADVLLREEFALPEELSVRDTLSAQAVATLAEATGGEGRIGLTGEIALEALHLSDIPGKPVVTSRHVIPVTESVAVSGDAGETLHGRITVKDVAVASQQTDGGAVLRAEVLLGLEAWAETEQTVSVLQDAYTISGDALRLERTALPVVTDTHSTHAAGSWRAPLLLGDGDAPLRTVLAAFAQPEVTAWEQQGSRLNVTGAMHATVVYMPDDGKAPVSCRAELPLKAAFAAAAGPDDLVRLTAAEVEAVPVTSDRAELRCVLHLTADGVTTRPVTLITDAAAVPADAPTQDIVLCYAQPGETWWDVARRYRIPEFRLHALNPDAQGELRPGQGVVVWRQPRAV